ncbi:hypothetical protein QZH41_010997 [Actinostola sp. cb2023]|nr:hypothetical protein QZH41_010997 [Actinostola sp. cb2023]
MSINYACKTVNKILDVRYEALGKALFHGPPSRIATAVIRCEPVRKEVVKKILGIVKNEVDDLCSRQKPSMLRKSGKDDLMKFDMQLLCQEWMSKAPLFYSFLLTCASSKNTSNTTLNWFPSIAVAGSVLLKQRNKAMSATANVLGILLKTKSIEVPLGVLFKNENLNDDMLDILKKFQSYLPRSSDGGYDGQLFAGDQLTVERAINVIASVANGHSPEDRLEGITLQLGDWHAGVKLLSVSTF